MLVPFVCFIFFLLYFLLCSVCLFYFLLFFPLESRALRRKFAMHRPYILSVWRLHLPLKKPLYQMKVDHLKYLAWQVQACKVLSRSPHRLFPLCLCNKRVNGLCKRLWAAGTRETSRRNSTLFFYFQLKMWDLRARACVQNYQGHINEITHKLPFHVDPTESLIFAGERSLVI